MRREFEDETNLFFFLFIFAYITPFPSLLVCQELKTPFPFRNEKVETVGVDNAPSFLLKFIHLAMRKFIKRKKARRKPISERGKGGFPVLYAYMYM